MPPEPSRLLETILAQLAGLESLLLARLWMWYEPNTAMAMATDRRVPMWSREKSSSACSGAWREAATGVRINGVSARPRLTSRQRRQVLGMNTP